MNNYSKIKGMKQIIELRDTEKRKMIAETFGISLANLSQILRFKRNGKNAEAIRRMAQEMVELNILKVMNHQK